MAAGSGPIFRSGSGAGRNGRCCWARTILISYVGTLSGAVLVSPLNFLAAENTSPGPWLRFTVKRLMEFCRTVPDIVFALIFVIAFGLGPMAGGARDYDPFDRRARQAICRDGREYRMKPVEGLRSTGASWIACMRFAVLPQVVARLRQLHAASLRDQRAQRVVMGFVGAGGIGVELITAIRKFYYSDVSAILLMIILTVFVIDIGTGWIRGRLFGEGAARMTERSMLETEGLRARYPKSSNGPASARLAWPAMLLGASAIFVVGLVLSASRRSGCGTACTSSGWISMMMLPPNPGSSLPLISTRWAKRSRSRCSAPRWRRCSRSGQPAGGQEHRAFE